ncbi:methyl-accepting chemotaxis protein [Sulfidibacter corallicola]|uniref:Methyl-accepting chemotaxis protein n=1 Tax=Sulfidibacter corallicola TaxID=2818388 RepID=A0A8A4TJA5_SULCO|nr:methyl-accepting chemotaxis protein [Sulfidibacter corallicola]QTD48931.1 methyl-accepting chemotaxis protein [Sulfidibacter corallicola]
MLVFIVSISVLPLLLFAAITLTRSQETVSNFSEETIQMSKDQVFNALHSARTSRRNQVQDYFGFLQKQNLSFAENPMITSHMADLTKAFFEVASTVERNPRRLDAYKEKVAEFYDTTFAEKYREHNPKQEAPGDALYAELPTASLVFQHDWIATSLHPPGEKDKLDRSERGSSYDRLHAQFHPVVRAYMERFGYYDIFLIEAETGYVVYSVFKEADFATSLAAGPYRDSGLAKAYRGAMARDSHDAYHLVDYSQYTPSYEAPASFLAAPIVVDGQKIGVLAFQIPLDRIDLIMRERTGLGESGEAILIGPDMLPRSDSHMDPARFSVDSAYRKGEAGKMNFPIMRQVFQQNQTGISETTDYLGREVVTAFAPVDLGPFKWGIAVNLSKEEAFQRAQQLATSGNEYREKLLTTAILILIPTLIIVIFLAILAVRTVVGPIKQMVTFAEKVAAGDLSDRLPLQRQDELGTLGEAINHMVDHLNRTIRTAAESASLVLDKAQLLDTRADLLEDSAERTMHETQEISDRAQGMTQTFGEVAGQADHTANEAMQVSVTVQKLASEATQITHTVGEISANSRQISAAVEEINATVAEISTTCTRAAETSSVGNESVGNVTEQIQTVTDSAGKIDAVITLIKSIAEQTNLLSLNATIEAATAGKAGAGFAVVAAEVKELAQKTREATGNIFKQVRALQEDSASAQDGILKVSESIEELNQVNLSVATMVEEQERTIHEVAKNLMRTTVDTEEIEQSIGGISQGLAEINQISVTASENARSINHSAVRLVDEATAVNRGVMGIHTKSKETYEFVREVNQAAREMREMAQSLDEIVSKFQL